jgi:hypothetical protein
MVRRGKGRIGWRLVFSRQYPVKPSCSEQADKTLSERSETLEDDIDHLQHAGTRCRLPTCDVKLNVTRFLSHRDHPKHGALRRERQVRLGRICALRRRYETQTS